MSIISNRKVLFRLFKTSFVGYKFVISGNPDRRKCKSSEYQPFTFSTNGYSTCIFQKTDCNEEGQIIINNGSTKSDRRCRCDYTRGYNFINKPEHGCYCVSSFEDCSCYQKPCPPGLILSPGKRLISMRYICNTILSLTNLSFFKN